MKATIAKYSGGSEGAAFLTSAQGTALGTSFAAKNWTATPSATSFSVGDRIVVKWWIIDAGGTMVSGNSVRTNYDVSTAGSNGDTWVQFSENLTFQSEPEVIQNKSALASSASSVTVPLNATGAGHLLAIAVSADEPSVMVSSVSDNAPGGSCNYVEVNNALIVDQVRSGSFTDIWYCAISNAGATAVTVTISPASGNALTAWVYEVGDMEPSSPVDVSGTSSDPSDSTFSGVSLTTTGNLLDFLLEVSNGLGTFRSITSPWTLTPGASSDPSAYLTAKGTFQPTITYSSTGASVTSGVAFRSRPPNQPPSVDAGPNQTIALPTNTVTLDGTATDDGLPNNTLTTSWTKVSGAGTVTFGNPSLANTQATFSAAGVYVLQLTASDSELSTSSNVTITVNAEPISLTLIPPSAGPNVTGTTQTLTAVLTTGSGPTAAPISGAAVSFAVSGANAASGNGTTDSAGRAAFTYTGTNSGTDTVQASYTGQNSNSSTVSWITPTQQVSTTTILGNFFLSDGSGTFDTLPTATPVFSQDFPTIDFNPPSGTVPGTPSNINENTRPFTDVTTDNNGNYTGNIIAQGNGYQAGVGPMNAFQAVFTGSLVVTTAGNQTINLYDDDGFILGIGGGATRVSGPMVNAPATSPFTGLTVVGAFNTNTEVIGNSIVVNFPAPGTYPFELDYTECCGGQEVLTMAVGSNNGHGIPPTGNLFLSPTAPPSLSTGQNQTFTVVATDAAGAAVQNANVDLVITGANPQQLSTTTNATGQASFQYSGANAGTDTLQASAGITGMASYSNIVNMTWAVSSDGLSVSAGPSQTITLPTNSVTLNGSASEPGVPANALLLSWTEVSGPAPVIFSNAHQAVALATFTTAGTYDLRLTASDNQLARSSDTTVTVSAQPVGNIEVCYLCSTNFGLGTFIDGPTFILRNTSTTGMTGGVLKIGPGGGVTDSFNVGAIPASGQVTVAPGLSNDQGTGHTFFAHTGSILDTSESGPNASNTQFQFTALETSFTADSGAFTPAATIGPSLDGTTSAINFLGGPGNADLPCNNCFDKVVANIGIANMPVLLISSSHTGNFYQGEQNATYTLTVSNLANSVSTAGTVTVSDTVPAGLTLVSMSGTGWTCSSTTCSRSDVLTSGATFPAITVSVNVDSGASSPLTNAASVSGGGFANANTIDPTVITSPVPQLTQLTPGIAQQGQQGLTIAITGQNTHFVQGTSSATFGAGITVQSMTVSSSTSATAVVNVSPTAPSGLSNVSVTTGSETATLISGFGVSGDGAIIVAPQGWIAQPNDGATIQGPALITVTSGITLASGTLIYWPTTQPSAVTTLNANTTGTGTIGTFDATTLASGGYTIRLNAIDSHGNSQVSQIAVSVVGSNKPGRMTSTVTEFKVPLAGIPITIARTYDSLEKNQNEDFGNGWKLGFNVDLTVDAHLNVTFNFNGQRQTFYFTPQPSSAFFPWLLNYLYTPQQGVHGTLTSNGCSTGIEVQGEALCGLGSPSYQPTVYTYTDPVGRVYKISSTGQLQSIQDLNGNTLTIAPSGVTSSVNRVVIPFLRDGSGRITQITDLNGNNYSYSYDASGNLQSVQYPGLTQAESYTYAADHSLLTQTDPRGNTSTSVYFSSANDGGQSQLDGRLFSFTDAAGNKWQYSYNLSTGTTTTTNPDTGTVVRADDTLGNPLSVTDPLGRITTYQYDSKENLIKVIRPCGHASCIDTTGSDTYTYGYDANGFQTSITDPLNHQSTKTYNSFGGVLTSTDAANTNTQTTSYDANFNPRSVTDLLNGASTPVSSSTFDASGNLLTSTDSNGKTTEFGYDPNGNLIQVIDAVNETIHLAYDPMDRMISRTDPLQNTTHFAYDALGRLQTKTDALQQLTQYTYDNNGNKTSETDPLGHTTSYQYDNMNRVTLITYPTSPATTRQFTYDFRGNKLTEVDQSGKTTKYVYDLAGQLISTTYAFGTADAGTLQYSYDLDGRVQTTTDERNNVTTNTYDAAGNLATVKDALTNVTTYGYDADNRKTSVQDPNHNTMNYAYDARGRLKTVTYPIAPPATQATTTQYTYDGVGRVLTTTDQAGNVNTNTYDDVGRLISVKDALTTPNVTQYFYDLNGNLKTLTDANGHTTTYQYDSLNRRIRRTLPLLQSETMAYDAAGNLHTKTDFNGKTTSYQYDQVNRLTEKIPDPSLGQTTVAFTYNPTGTRATMVDASGTTTYSAYDNRDRLKTKITPEGTLNYTYDAHGNLLTIASSNTDGASLTYTYDALNRLATVTDNRIAAQGGPSGPTTYSYDAAGNLSGYIYSNSVQIGNAFDPLNRLTQTCAATTAPACSASTKLASYTYTLGSAGDRLNLLELNSRNVAYGYDNDYRLTSETITGDPAGNNGTVTYNTYDNVGNRTQTTSTLSAVPGGSFSYDANDRLAIDIYDANGNTTSSAGISNTYDFEDRMLTHGSLSLVHNGDGNRVSETIGGTTTKYLVDDHNPTGLPQVLDEIAGGSVTRTYAYGLQRISENQLISGTWTPSFYGYDGHGNVRFLTNSVGSITDSYDYEAFGMPIRSSGTTPNQFLYSGERYDSSIGLYDLRARYLNQTTGRFWSRDPIEGKKCCGLSWNPYIYVKQNPVNASDPTGRDAPEYVFQLEVDIELKSPLSLEMRATAHVIDTIVDCVEVLLEFGYSNTFAWELCIERAGNPSPL